MIVFVCVVAALACFRITRFLTRDTLTAGLRARTHGWLAELLFCPWCVSVYVAAGIVLWFDLRGSVPAPALTIAALSAVAGLLSNWSDD